MPRQKVYKHEEKLRQIFPLLRDIKIQRLSEKDALKYLEKAGEKMGRASYYNYKRDYENSSQQRFLQIARVEYADEHLVLLDRFHDTIKKYYELLEEAETPLEAKQILDSIRNASHDVLMMYNEVPMVHKIKDIIDEQLGKSIEHTKDSEKP